MMCWTACWSSYHCPVPPTDTTAPHAIAHCPVNPTDAAALHAATHCPANPTGAAAPHVKPVASLESTFYILHSTLGGGSAAAALPVTYHANNTPATLAALARDIRNGDCVAFVGAGNIDRSARDWLALAAKTEKENTFWKTAAIAMIAECGLRIADFQTTQPAPPPLASEVLSSGSGGVHAAIPHSAIRNPQSTLIRANEPLAPKTTMRTGGPARLYAEPATESDLARLLAHARAHSIPVLMLGRGSNLLIPDEGIDALVISLAHETWRRFEILPDSGSARVPRADGTRPESRPKSPPCDGAAAPHSTLSILHSTLDDGDSVAIVAGAGLRLKNLSGLAAAANLPGLEFLEGIPGTLGGALRMNAGAMGDEIFNHVETVRVMDTAGNIRTLRPAEMGVTYRHCAALAATGPNALIALSATLRIPHSEIRIPHSQILARIEANRAKRHLAQPREPSAGSIFKNPPNASAGRLIDAAGLKGHRIGGAEVSPLHANFIINRDNAATTTDIIELIRHIRATVAAKHAIPLTPEVLLYGADWKDYL